MLRTRPITRGNRLVWGQTSVYLLCFSLVGILSATLGPSIASFSAAAGVPPSELSTLFVTDAFGSVCGSLLAGHLLDRIAPHVQAVLGLTGITALVVAIPLLTRPELLLPAWWGLGMSKTFLIVTVNTLLIRVRSEQVGPYMNVADFFLGVGSLLMPMAIAQSITWTDDLRWAYWAAGLAAVLLMGRIWSLPSPRAAADRGGDAQAAPGRHPLVIPVAALLFLYVGAEISFSGWIPSYTLARGITDSAATAAYYTSLFWIAITVGRLLWLPVTRRWPPQRLILVNVTACVLILGALWVSPVSSLLLAVETVAFGFAMSSIFPSAFTWLAQRGEVTGKVSAWCLCAASVGAMFFPWWIGQFVVFQH
ncbi:MFS transporter [Microbispora rosea subsp. aerata]|nr:MFS transporter [Microbispora rosea]GGO14461.1 MFS transporter [Microbispora rosea subsp. aerata]